MKKYVHGYSKKEAIRLNDQANSLEELIHHDTVWDKGSLVLEAGCGVGAHTKIIAKKNPGSNFISIDISQNQKTNTVEYSANYPDYAEGYREHSYHYSTPHRHGMSFGQAMFLAYMFRPHYSPYHPAFMYPMGYHRPYMSPAIRMQTRSSYRTSTSTTKTVTKTTRSKSYKQYQ